MKFLNIRKTIAVILLVCINILIASSCANTNAVVDISSNVTLPISDTVKVAAANSTSGNSEITADILKIHYLSVGNADCILIELNKEYALIDTGNYENKDQIEEYLNKLGVKKLKYLLLTHYHADHIGSSSEITKDYDIGKIYSPKIPKSKTPKTAAYKYLIKEMNKKKLSFTDPTVGSTLELSAAKITILGPNSSDYEDANDFSIVCRLTYGQTSFLFMGDAGTVSEKEMLSKKLLKPVNSCKISHHGSKTGSSNKLLSTIKATYGIISVGTGNDYGHPNKETLNRLKKQKMTVYRTDLDGTIIESSDGKNITFTKHVK